MQLVELQRIAGALSEQGIAPFAISYDSVDTLRAFAEKNLVTFPLLADEGSHAITALGMLDEHLDEHHAEMGGTVRDDQRGVCYPGVFLLDEHGVVVQRRFQRNYRVRESGATILEQALDIASPDTTPAAEIARAHVRLTAHIDSATYWRYQRLNFVLDLDIAPGWHVYAAPTPDGYTPLTITLSGDGLVAGQPDWPSSAPFHVAGLDEHFMAYEGKLHVAVPFEFIIQRGEPMGDRSVHVAVEYQACTANACDVPRRAEFELVVRERPAVE